MDVSETLSLARAAPRQTKTETKKTQDKTGESFQDTLSEKVNDSTPTTKEEPKVKVDNDTEENDVEETKKEVINVEVAAQQMAVQISLLNNDTVEVDSDGTSESETQVDEQQALVAAAMDALLSIDEGTEAVTTTAVNNDPTETSATLEVEESMSDIELETENLSLDAGQETEQIKPEIAVSNATEEVSDTAGLLGVFKNVQNTAVENTVSTVSSISDELQNVNMDQLLNQVEAKIQTMIKTGETSISIKVHPENLGQVNIKLVSGSDGVQVYLSAEKPATGQLLESGIEQLQEILNTAGVNIGSMTVGYQQPQGSNEEMAQWFNRRGFSNGLDLSAEKVELLNGQGSLGQTSLTALDYSA